MLKYILIILALPLALQAQQFGSARDYYYSVKSSEYEKMDTLALLGTGWLESGKYSSMWFFDTRESSNLVSKEEIKGIQNDTMVLLKMPTSAYLFDTGKVPYPQIRFPMNMGDSIFSSHSYPTDVEGYDSTEVNGYIKVIDYEEETVEYRDYDKTLKTWTLESYNSDNPEYNATYVYSSEYGFTSFKYYLAGKEIEINHYSTTHREY